MKQLNTEAFDHQEVLNSWDFKEEQKKADFLERLYQVYKPTDHCYTGLWQRFLNEEAGPYCRNLYFERVKAVEEFTKAMNNETQEANV